MSASIPQPTRQPIDLHYVQTRLQRAMFTSLVELQSVHR